MASVIDSSARVSERIDEFTRKYLLDTLEPGFYASDFSQERFDVLLNELIAQHGKDKTLTRMDTVRSAIYKHFKASDQECEVNIDGSAIKIVNQLKCGVQTAEMDRALLGLDTSMKRMLAHKEKYLLQENLVCYPQEELSGLYQLFVATELEEDYAAMREKLRISVQESFDLQSRDIVIFLRKNLYVRYFVDLRAKQESQSRRFMGVSADDLAHIYTISFPEDFGEILLEMATEVINDALDFNRIDNLTFKTKYIEVFRALVDVAMADYTDDITADNVMALNGYILRIYFDELLYRCAEILIEKVMQRNKKADKFLHFYNGEVVIGANGKKIKKPFITDTNGNIWNFGSVFSVMTQCVRYEDKHTQQSEAIRTLNDHYQEASSFVTLRKEGDRKCGEALTRIRQQLDACTLVKNNLSSISKPMKEEVAKLLEKKAEEKLLLDKHAKLYSQKNDTALRLENAKITERRRLKQVDMAKKSLRQLERNGEVLLRQKETILKALAKAIAYR
jgi:hypothetical protein